MRARHKMAEAHGTVNPPYGAGRLLQCVLSIQGSSPGRASGVGVGTRPAREGARGSRRRSPRYCVAAAGGEEYVKVARVAKGVISWRSC